MEGSKVLLPVFVRGALFSCGDGHAAQGDGEVCGSAIETHMLVKARLTVIKPGAGGLQPSAPLLQYLTPKEVGLPGPHYATTGIGPDLFAAAREAVGLMVRWLVENRALDPYDAYIVCSCAVSRHDIAGIWVAFFSRCQRYRC